MTPEFSLFYDQHLSQVEGGVVDHDLDKGGATWYGISTGFLAGIGRKGPISRADAKQIAFDYFWEPNGCQAMDPVAAWCYCDALFNHSPKAAAQMLQTGLNVEADGIAGPKTHDAAKVINQKLFIERYQVARTRYYVALVKKDATQLVFLVGWVTRVHKLNQAMIINGLFSESLKALPWYSPEKYSVNTKATGFGVGAFVFLTGLFWPDIDADTITGLIKDPDALRVALISVFTGLVAKWRAK